MAGKLEVLTVVPQGSVVTLQLYGRGEVDLALAERDARIRELEAQLPHTGADMEPHHFSGQTADVVKSDNSKVNAALLAENQKLKAQLEALQSQAVIVTAQNSHRFSECMYQAVIASLDEKDIAQHPESRQAVEWIFKHCCALFQDTDFRPDLPAGTGIEGHNVSTAN